MDWISDLGRLVTVFGAILGQIIHILKKKTEEENNAAEKGLFRKWIIDRPITTVVASLTGITMALGMQVDGLSLFDAFLHALVAGFAANSLINRPGEE